MQKGQNKIGQSMAGLTLPVFPYFKHIIFPHTVFLISPDVKSPKRIILEKISKNDPPECVVVVQNSNLKETDPASFSKIGVVSAVEVTEAEFKVFAKYKAVIENLAHYPKHDIWKADISRLPDIPELAELTDSHCDLPMILGGVESIYCLLQDLKPLVKEKELEIKLVDQIKKLKQIKREKETAYFLPWHILIDFGYLPEEIKSKMLETNSVMERLQIVIDILKNEKAILRNAEMLSEDDPSGLGKNGGK